MNEAEPETNVTQLGIEPKQLTEDETQALKDGLRERVAAGAAEIVASNHYVHLRSLAYYEGDFEIDQLEAELREEMRACNYSDSQINKFSLKAFKKAALDLRKAVADRADAIARRNADNQEIDVAAAYKRAQTSSPVLVAEGVMDERLKGRVWYDEFHHKFFTNWDGSVGEEEFKRIVDPPVSVNDAWVRKLQTWLCIQDPRVLGKCSEEMARRTMRAVGERDKRNCAQDWLKELKWDGVPRLNSWLHEVYHVEQSYYHERVGINWFVSMVARIMVPGCKVDTMPVLVGPEGVGKSTSLEIIGGQDGYLNMTISLSRKPEDFKQALQGRILVEIAEMESFTKAEATAIKSLLAVGTDSFRVPYGAAPQDYKRTCVMVSTTNDFSWHKEETGMRRFWPILCASLTNKVWLESNLDQLWAEAYALWKGGASWHGDEIKGEQNALVTSYTEADEWQGPITRWATAVEERSYVGLDDVEPDFGDVSFPPEDNRHWGNVITTSRIAYSVLGLGVAKLDGRVGKRIAGIMRKAGWKQLVKTDKGRKNHRIWVTSEIDVKNVGNSDT
jgi:predicted P-loop ATPase